MRLRSTTAALAATALMLTGPAALADLVSNDLDDSVDTDAESMSLEYDTQGTGDRSDDVAGTSLSTRLRVVVDGVFVETAKKEHPHCNLKGDHYVTLAASESDADVVTLSFPDGLTFDTCDETVAVGVTPADVGDTYVTFTVVDSKLPHGVKVDPAAARFRVTVTQAELDGDSPSTGTKCDRDPAAPAWANAILKANDVDLRGKDRRDVIRAVAQRMAKAASFPDNSNPNILVAKSADTYPDEVYEYMKTLGPLRTTDNSTMIDGVGPEGVDRPGRVCITVRD